MDTQLVNFDFVAIGLAEVTRRKLEELVDSSRVKFVDRLEEFEAFVENFETSDNVTLFVSNQIKELQALELGQTLRASYLNAHIVFIATDAKQFSVSELKKNGFSKAFLMPMDQIFFEDLVISSSRGGIRKKYKAIRVVDIEPGETLNFNVYVYMSANKKYALLTADGSISDKKYELLKSRSEDIVFIQRDQAEKFYDYSAEKIARLHSNRSVDGSETENGERLRQNIQALFHNILDQKSEASFDSGRDLLEQSYRVIHKFVDKKTKTNLKQQIERVFDIDSDSYSHAQTVSSLSCLLSMATGTGLPEELAIAGLFHDIGISGFEIEPTPLTIHTLNNEEMARYSIHPISSIHILKNKKIVLTPAVSEIIEKHHERIDGKGFPEGLPAHKIPLSAQLLAFCDWLEYLMRIEPGRARLTPLEATEVIQSKAGLSMELILKIKDVFSKLESEKKSSNRPNSIPAA